MRGGEEVMKGLLVHELTNLSSPRYYYAEGREALACKVGSDVTHWRSNCVDTSRGEIFCFPLN